MKKIFEILVYSIIIALIILGIYFLFTENSKYDGYDRKLEELKYENEELRAINDSLKQLLIEESFRYDSLMAVIDSSVDKYNETNVRYEIIRDSIRYLDADESINFLREKLLEYEMDN